jgi:hypothetical protein
MNLHEKPEPRILLGAEKVDLVKAVIHISNASNRKTREDFSWNKEPVHLLSLTMRDFQHCEPRFYSLLDFIPLVLI